MASVDSSSGSASATVADLIDRATETIAAGGCEEPRPDAEALVAETLEISVEKLASDGKGDLPPAAVQAIEAMRSGKPSVMSLQELHARARARS